METSKVSDRSGFWTNERHVHFLNSMEASFVQTMFENNVRLVRLDRYLPDSCESTLDLKRKRRRRHLTSDIVGIRHRTDKKARRPSSHPYTSSEDQVVPQFEIGAGAKDDKDHLAVPIPLFSHSN